VNIVFGWPLIVIWNAGAIMALTILIQWAERPPQECLLAYVFALMIVIQLELSRAIVRTLREP
jgi:hypothetical protein